MNPYSPIQQILAALALTLPMLALFSIFLVGEAGAACSDEEVQTKTEIKALDERLSNIDRSIQYLEREKADVKAKKESLES